MKGEEKEKDEDERERTRSPRADLAKEEQSQSQEEKQEKEKKQEREEQEHSEKAKKRVKDDSGHRDAAEGESQRTWWTQEEWDKWKLEQEEWRSRMETGASRERKENDEWRRRMETGASRSETRFTEYKQQQAGQHDLQLETNATIHNAITESNLKIATVGSEVARQQRDLQDVREATSILIQWNKSDQRDEADKQIKLLGWAAENRYDRKAVVERWITMVEGWDDYYTVRTLNGGNGKGKGKGKLLSFSLLEAKTKEGRESLLAKLRGNKMFGFHGNEIWGKRNVPKHIREGGHVFRFVMRCIENIMPNTRFEHIDWTNEALKLDGRWIAAVLTADHTGRKRSICIAEDCLDISTVEDEANRLWRTYLGYDKRSTSTSSSSSLMTSLQSQDWKVYYVQDHHDFDVCAMPLGLPDTLDLAKAEKEEAEEARRMERAAVHHGYKQKEEQQEEEAQDEQMGQGDHLQQKANLQPQQPPQHPQPQQQHLHVPTPPSMLGKPGDKYEDSSDSDSTDDGLTSAQAREKAKQDVEELLKIKKPKTKNPWADLAAEEERQQMEQEHDDEMQGLPNKGKLKPPKEGTSAWAVGQAKAKAKAKAAAGKKAVYWNEEVQQHHYEKEEVSNSHRGKKGGGLDYYEEPGEYTDQWGIAHPHTSEDYKTDPGRYDQLQWAPRKGKGGNAGGKKWRSQGGKGGGGGNTWGGQGQVWQEAGVVNYNNSEWDGWGGTWW